MDDEIAKDIERRRRALEIAVPTDDGRVKILLRQLGHPVCLFGEQTYDRRGRLRDLLSRLTDEQLQEVKAKEEEEEKLKELAKKEKLSEDVNEEFYTEGSETLKNAREFIAGFSLPRTKNRLDVQKTRNETPLGTLVNHRKDIFGKLRGLTSYASQIGDTRPLSYCSISPDGKLLATGGFSGESRLWSIPSCSAIRTLRGHEDRIGAIVFHPQSGLSQSPSAINLASCSADSTVALWNLQSDRPLAKLRGHTMRVARVAFHPSGRFLGSTGYDYSWRLWDVDTQQEILLQEGHSREVYSIAFQREGGLVVTGGLDAIGRVWDLRSGKSIFALEGHVGPIVSTDFSGNGYHIATGSEDNTVRIWDLRKKESLTTLTAHKSVVSCVRFQPTLFSEYLISSSFDHTFIIWSSGDWKPIKNTIAHENKVMHVDISLDGQQIVTCAYDRTFKLWANESESAKQVDVPNMVNGINS